MDITQAPVFDRMGIQLVETTPERCIATMPVEGNTQPFGVLHGGASALLAETVASIAATLHAQRNDPETVSVGVDLNATHHRAARSGRVTGVATGVHLGRTTATYEVVITDESDRRICTARLTCYLGFKPG